MCDLFGTIKDDGYRQFTTVYVEFPKKQGKSELATAVALLLACGDGEQATGLVETRKNLKLPEADHLQADQQFLSGAFR